MGLEQPMNYWYIYGLDMMCAQVKSNHKFSKMYIVIILHKMKGDVLHFVFVFTFLLLLLFFILHFVFVFVFTFTLFYDFTNVIFLFLSKYHK